VPPKGSIIESLGARPVFGDVLDASAMHRVALQVQPDAVVELLNALPKRGPLKVKELEGTNELRIKGTRNLIDAAVRIGATRFVAESMIFGYGYSGGDRLVTEDDLYPAPAPIPEVQPALDALGSLESQVLEATRDGKIEGVVLRLGLFYGPGVGSTEFMTSLLKKRVFVLPGGGKGRGSWIHVEDAARAVVLALGKSAPGQIYNVVDDRPASVKEFASTLSEKLDLPKPHRVPLWVARLGGRYGGMVATAQLGVSNEKIKRELGWEPHYPTIQQGIESLREGAASIST
jgi:nucleoside-diphosphate-sugar epimerase